MNGEKSMLRSDINGFESINIKGEKSLLIFSNQF